MYSIVQLISPKIVSQIITNPKVLEFSPKIGGDVSKLDRKPPLVQLNETTKRFCLLQRRTLCKSRHVKKIDAVSRKKLQGVHKQHGLEVHRFSICVFLLIAKYFVLHRFYKIYKRFGQYNFFMFQ